MISNIIEESYRRKNIPKRKINLNNTNPKEPFHQIIIDRLNHSTAINSKVRRKEKFINDRIDKLLDFSVIDIVDEDPNSKNSLSKLHHKVGFPFGIISKRAKLNKYLFKGDMTIAEKINKTKIKEFSLSNPINKKIKIKSLINYLKNKNKDINKDINKDNTSSSRFFPLSAKISINNIKYRNISNSDCFFITKLPNYNYRNNSAKSKEIKLKKMKKIIRETNSHMLDIYTGLKNMKLNKFSTYDNPLAIRDIKYKKGFKNIDKLSLGIPKNLSVSYIKRKFKKLFKNIFEIKKTSNEKLDARTLLDPLEKISGGIYKEVKLDNNVNKKLGQRIWIKKSTANIVSYGKSFQMISDDIFYKERKRIIGIYPKIEKDANLFLPYKKIEKRNPLIKKIQENVNKLNNVYICDHKLLTKIRNKYFI